MDGLGSPVLLGASHEPPEALTGPSFPTQSKHTHGIKINIYLLRQSPAPIAELQLIIQN